MEKSLLTDLALEKTSSASKGNDDNSRQGTMTSCTFANDAPLRFDFKPGEDSTFDRSPSIFFLMSSKSLSKRSILSAAEFVVVGTLFKHSLKPASSPRESRAFPREIV